MSGTLEKRFMRKRGPKLASGCMEWNGYYINSGYGGMRVGKSHTTAHRVAYELHYGKIPVGMEVMHSCDNRRCVNWEHLSLGTHRENVDDMVIKGRQKKSQISEDDLSDIKMMRSHGMTMSEIAKQYGVSRPLISLVLSGKIQRLTT